jgi:hypothetical protein
MTDRDSPEDFVPEADWADQRLPVVPEPHVDPPPVRPDVPETDALDQSREVEPGPRAIRHTADPEAPEADAHDQAIEVPFDDEPW